MKPASRWRLDLAVALVAAGLLLAWDFSGADLATARLFGTATGFALRDAFWPSHVLHDGGRWLSWALLGGLIVAALRPAAAGAPTRADRWRWIGVILLCVIAVPLIKQTSRSSCPWELAEFGGVAPYVSHWTLGLTDGGPGRCFPSGHAVAAFAFFGLYFLWRGHDARRAGWWLALVLALGALYGGAQLVRGAHYPSHTLWTAWVCWAIGALADAVFRWRAWPRA